MAIAPRKLKDGSICCSRADTLCPKCQAHFATQEKEMTTLEAHDQIPDPYAQALKDRKPTQRDVADTLTPGMLGYDPYGAAPNGYDLDLARRIINQKESK